MQAEEGVAKKEEPGKNPDQGADFTPFPGGELLER